MPQFLSRTWKIINEDPSKLQVDLRQATGVKERSAIFLGIATKALITLLFCVVFVVAFISVLGHDNAIVGVVVLLSVLTFQKVDFGYSKEEGALALFLIFALFATLPPLALHVGGFLGAVIMMVGLLIILIMGCDQVAYHNHVVLVLSFLLLYGYPAPREAQTARIAGLLLGGAWAASIMLRKHKHNMSGRDLEHVFRAFNPRKIDDEWKLKLAVLVPLAMWCGQLLGLGRTMWIGIAAMSVLSPYEHLRGKKMVERFLGTLLGTLLFYCLTLIPGMTPTLVGLSGGFLVGLTTSYRYQTVFNSLGALSVAMLLMGPHESILYRIADNIFAIAFVVIAVYLIDIAVESWQRRHALKSAHDPQGKSRH
ncbi:FUSC family protein [Actinomyces vulturis]|uniref:FUSC family protein n=1 Tax=Actinomyces vulturis TaxID=1857645 RepID=UPI001147183D|nr:FUSC family protein [Actinomyces vulturis]